MANGLDELKDYVNEEGRDVNVIEKQLKITIGSGTKVFFNVICWFLLIIPGIVVLVKKMNAGKYLSQLEQKVQHDASTIDNYLEQRVMILQNAAKLVDRAIDLDKDTFTKVAELRSGRNPNNDELRNEVSSKIDDMSRNINIAFEQYPDLKAHQALADAMQQNSYLQREITAAREVYNNTINQWNRAVFEWPIKQMVAAKRGYTTRIPFSASKETKERAREVFF